MMMPIMLNMSMLSRVIRSEKNAPESAGGSAMKMVTGVMNDS